MLRGMENKDGGCRFDPTQSEITWSGAGADGATVYGAVATDAYPSGEPLVKWPSENTIERVLLRPRSMSAFMTCMFWLDALAWRGRVMPELILPCVPGARQDRMNGDGDYLFTAKSIAKEINSRDLPIVTVLDPHSDVTPALIDRCRVMPNSYAAAAVASSTYAGVVSPDSGAEKRAGTIATLLHLPLIHGWKKRDVSSGALSGFGVQPMDAIPEGRLLIVDDLCDGGGTFIGLAAELAQHGREADLFVTHGFFSKGVAPLLRCFGKIITTDSVVGTDAAAGIESPEREAARLASRILKSREGRIQVIPICAQLLLQK